MDEATLLHEVTRLCDELGLYHYHTARPLGSDRGWPDLAIIGRRVLYRELKVARNTPSHDQALVGWKLKAAGQDFAVWRPRDLTTGTIERQLREIT